MDEARRCPLCGGRYDIGTTTFTVDYSVGVLVVRQIPAGICSPCGEAWINDETSAELERLVLEAKSTRRQFEVIDLAA